MSRSLSSDAHFAPTAAESVAVTPPRRPRESGDPYAAAVVLRDVVRRLSRHTPAWWLWVPAFAGTTKQRTARRAPSLLPESAHQLIAQRLDQIGQQRAVAGLHKGFHRHAGDHLDVAEAGDLFRRHRDADRVIGLPGALIGGDVRRNAGDDTGQ